MNKRIEQSPQDQGVLSDPIRPLDDEDEDEAMDDLEKAALALGMSPERMTEADGVTTELG